MATRMRFVPGRVLAVPLDDGRWSYGRMLSMNPNMAFHHFTPSGPDPTKQPLEVVECPVIFVLSVVYGFAGSAFGWQAIGKVPLDLGDAAIPDRFIQTRPIPEDIKIMDARDRIRPATKQECLDRQLERASVWQPNHVMDRLSDFFGGRPQRWVNPIH